MLIDYKKPNVLTVYTSNENDSIKTGIPGYKFIPGINEVKTDDWKKIAATPKVLRLIDADELVVVTESDAKENKTSIAGIAIEKCKAVVDRTYNKGLLVNWLDCETRGGVVQALREQLRMIDRVTKKPSAEAEAFA